MQHNHASTDLQQNRRKTRKEAFLNAMDALIPWQGIIEIIAPFHATSQLNPKPRGLAGVAEVERLLRIRFLQSWFDLSDSAVEEALYDSRAMADFAGIDTDRDRAPNETMIRNFRHTLEKHNLGDHLFELVDDYLLDNDLKLSKGAIAEASIVKLPTAAASNVYKLN